jgi:hypothetical protein
MNLKKFLNAVDKAARIFSAIGVMLINYAAGNYVAIQLSHINQTLATFMFFISGFCPTYLFISYIADLLGEKRDDKNGSDNAGKG